MNHSIIAPSSAPRWVRCPGSAVAEAAFPGENSAPAIEGTAVHEIGADLITAVMRGRPVATNGPKYLGVKTTTGVIVDQDMISAAMAYATHAEQLMHQYHIYGGEGCGVERRFAGGGIHDQLFGTCDFWISNGDDLHIVDLKYGFGLVEAHENWQLLCYAAAFDEPHTRIHLTIVQPRAYHRDGQIRTWTIDAATLKDRIATLAESATLALGPNPPTHNGPHCRYCNARHACGTIKQAAAEAVDLAGRVSFEVLSPAALSSELDALQRAAETLKYRLTGLETQAKEMIRLGTHIPGYSIETGQGSKVWNVPPETVIQLGACSGLDLSKPITPTQAQKKGLDSTVVNALSKRNSGTAKLVRDNPDKAKAIFGR